MGWSKLFKSELVPDKDDPRYRERYEAIHSAGGKFARMTGLTWLGRRIVLFANEHKKLYIALAFGFLACSLLKLSGQLIMSLCSNGRYVPVTERVDSALQDRFHECSGNEKIYEETTDTNK